MRREDLERELDAIDYRLLKDAEAAGEISPKNLQHQQRLDRLDLEGYVESARHDPAEPGGIPFWVYRLTSKGAQAVTRGRV